MKGPVYLVPGGHTLPDLVADLRGQVNIQLRGVISSKRGGIKTVFNNVPDVAVKKFVLKMQGGKKGLIVNSTNICKGERRAILNMKGQNGKQVKSNKYKLNSPAARRRRARSSETRRKHRRGGPNSLRAGAPVAFHPRRRLEQPRQSWSGRCRRCCRSWAPVTS